MTSMEQEYCKIAIEYREEYENTKWWKFSKRRKIKSKWHSALELMIKHGSKI